MTTNIKQILIRVSEDEFNRLTHYARLHYRTKNEVLREFIRKLPAPPQPKPKKRAKKLSK